MTLALPSPRILAAGAAAVALLGAGALVGSATAGGDGDPARTASDRAAKAMDASGVGYCAVAFSSVSDDFYPTNDFVDPANTASSVQLRKTCAGPATATFTTETFTSTGYIHGDVVATCVSKGGLSNACKPGAVVSGGPGHVYLNDSADLTMANAFVWTFDGMKKGVWRFDLIAGSDGGDGDPGTQDSHLGYRTLKVEAINPGA